MTNALATVESREQHPLVVGIQQRMATPAFAKMLPAGMDMDRFAAVTIQAIVKNPDLLSCTPESVIAAVVEAAQDGLEPTGARGGAHLVKFGPEAVLIRDYRGIIRIIIESGAAKRVDAHPVRHNDVFALDYASPDPVTHRPEIPPTGEVYGYYSLFWLPDGTKQAEFMTVDDIEQVRAKSRGKDQFGWTEFFDQMARKTVIKRGSNYLNLRPDIRDRLLREDAAEFEGQIISVQRDERLAGARQRIHERTQRLTAGGEELPAPVPERTKRADEPPCPHPAELHQTTSEGIQCGRCTMIIARRNQPATPVVGRAVQGDAQAEGVVSSDAPSATDSPAAAPSPPGSASPAPTTLEAATERTGTLAIQRRLFPVAEGQDFWTAFDAYFARREIERPPLENSPQAIDEWNALGDRIEIGEFPSEADDPAGRCQDHDAAWKWVPPGTNQKTKKAYNGFFACSGDRDCKNRPSDAWRRAHKPAA